MLRLATFTLLFLFVQMTYGVAVADDCLSPNDSMADYRDLIHQAAVVNENGRRSEEEYATYKVKPLIAVQNRFSPTGVLKCDGSELSAQLTGATGVITTAAHAFRESDTCKKIAEPDSCTFTVKIGSSLRISKVSGLIESGYKCPKKPEMRDDWAVLTIDPPLAGIEPYGLPENLEIKEGDEVISISAESRDFYRIDPKTKRKYLPKSIEECQTKRIYGITRAIAFESDCDSSRGNSGGSVLKVENGRDVLLGITVSNDESEKQLLAAEKRGTPNVGTYKTNKWATYHVPLNDRFLAVVKKAAGDQSL